jgi:hypothetical protein
MVAACKTDLNNFGVLHPAVYQLDSFPYRVVREHAVNNREDIACVMPRAGLYRHATFCLKPGRRQNAMTATVDLFFVERTETRTSFSGLTAAPALFSFSAATIFSRCPIFPTPTSFNASRSCSGRGSICTSVLLSVISSSSNSG